MKISGLDVGDYALGLDVDPAQFGGGENIEPLVDGAPLAGYGDLWTPRGITAYGGSCEREQGGLFHLEAIAASRGKNKTLPRIESDITLRGVVRIWAHVVWDEVPVSGWQLATVAVEVPGHRLRASIGVGYQRGPVVELKHDVGGAVVDGVTIDLDDVPDVVVMEWSGGRARAGHAMMPTTGWPPLRDIEWASFSPLPDAGTGSLVDWEDAVEWFGVSRYTRTTGVTLAGHRIDSHG